MAHRFIFIYMFLLLGMVCSQAQKRLTIDRTRQTTVTKKKKSTGKSSSTASKKTYRSATATKKTSKKSYLTITSETENFNSNGGTRTFTVSSSGTWYVNISTASWGHLTRDGNTLTLIVDANTNTSSRSDYFVIKSSIKTQK